MTGEVCTVSHSLSAKVEDDYNLEYYSFAIEYTGPPVSFYIPQVAPVDVDRIPTAVIAAEAVISSELSLPVVQPIMKGSVDSLKEDFFSNEEGDLYAMIGDGGDNVVDVDVSYSSSGTVESSDVYIDSNELLGSWDFGELADDACNDHTNPETSDSKELSLGSPEISSEVSRGKDSDLVEELPSSPRVSRVPVVTFRNIPPSDYSSSEEIDEDENVVLPRRLDMKKGECYRCKKRCRFAQKVVCIVCRAEYCRKCVLRAMGSMPEGRKCITCIGHRVDESRRRSLGKCSRMLGRLLGCEAVKQIMSAEISCTFNQLPPHLIIVNDKPLSVEELIVLQSCSRPPKRLKPGKYWYDKVSGFWGKDGEKPSQIITADLGVGYSIRPDASNGNTGVLINSREITKAELWMLQAAGIHYEGSPHFWVTPDGSYQHEGMNYVMGKLWDKKRVKLVCVALSLPFPSDTTTCCGEIKLGKDMNKVNPMSVEKRMMHKLLLVGCHQTGTSTIYKQAKFLYDVPFSEDEKESIKFKIQRNLYRYIATLLEEHEIFAKEHETEMNKLADTPGPSGASDQVDEKSVLSFSPRLKAFTTWLLQVMMSGNLESIFPAATREYSPLVEELWKDKCFQATFKRSNELHTLPAVAHYFLEKAIEISQMDYEPSQMDILYAGGIGSSNGISSMEFSFPKSSDEEDLELLDLKDPPASYQLIRIHASILGENCKRLEMFEDVDLVIYCVSLTEYDEYHEDINGVLMNKMLATKKHFETIATHETLIDKYFLLLLTKYDLLEEKIQQCPLTQCEWFQDFSPVTSHHSNNPSTNNPPLAQHAFHYIAVKFKRLFYSLTGRTLFVSRITGLQATDVDKALKYGREILKWNDERRVISTNEFSTESGERSTTG